MNLTFLIAALLVAVPLSVLCLAIACVVDSILDRRSNDA